MFHQFFSIIVFMKVVLCAFNCAIVTLLVLLGSQGGGVGDIKITILLRMVNLLSWMPVMMITSVCLKTRARDSRNRSMTIPRSLIMTRRTIL